MVELPDAVDEEQRREQEHGQLAQEEADPPLHRPGVE